VVSYLPGTGLRTLGVPVCHPVGAEFASQVWGESVAEVRRLLSLLELLPQSHIQYTLLRACMDACRVNDLLRGSSLRDGEDAVRGMSALLWSTLGVVVGAPVLGAQWSQASLPVRCGVLVDIQPLVEWAGNLTAMLEAGQKYSSQRWGGGESGGVKGAGVEGAGHGAGPSAVCVPAAAPRGSMVGVGAVCGEEGDVADGAFSGAVEVVARDASSGDGGGAPVLPVSGANERLG